MNEKKNIEQKLLEALMPILEGKKDLKKEKMLLHQMFASAVSNAPDDEIDNFTARRLTPFYLALCETLENLENTLK